MTTFPGFTLPDELRLIREQVRRFIREEIIPLEQRLDPDAPGIPDEDFKRLSEKTKARSEEHTSELQSRPHLVCRLLLEKKKPAIQSSAASRDAGRAVA